VEKCTVIVAILQENRVETATKVQEVLTEYGCYIRVRLGLHDAAVDECSTRGLILLQMCGENIPLAEFIKALEAIRDVKVKYMHLDF